MHSDSHLLPDMLPTALHGPVKKHSNHMLYYGPDNDILVYILICANLTPFKDLADISSRKKGLNYRLTDHTPLIYGPQSKKTGLQDFRQGEFQTSLLSYRD